MVYKLNQVSVLIIVHLSNSFGNLGNKHANYASALFRNPENVYIEIISSQSFSEKTEKQKNQKLFASIDAPIL